jgi:hypothetical protein
MAGLTPASSAPPPARALAPLSWQRLVLLVVLLNTPLFFQGCGPNHSVRFTAGAVLPFVEIVSPDPPPQAGSLRWWSAWRCLVNIAATAAGVWLLCRIRWIGRVAESRWAMATLVIVALVFNAWWYFPDLWVQAVYSPTAQLTTLLIHCVTGEGTPHQAVAERMVTCSARLYYLACLVVVGGVTFVLQVFFRRYFFVPAGHWWQVQLGGLMVVVLVLGTAIGVVARLLMQQQ